MAKTNKTKLEEYLEESKGQEPGQLEDQAISVVNNENEERNIVHTA